MRDVSKILSDAEILKIRALLDQHPISPSDLSLDGPREYPKMLFAPGWVECYSVIKTTADPLTKKDWRAKIRTYQIVVTDIETEEEYLAEGWVTDPIELFRALGQDPRVPTGREGRRALAQTKDEKRRRLDQLRREYAALTGRRLVEDDEDVQPRETDPMPEPEPVVEEPISVGLMPPPPALQDMSDKRARVASAAKRSARA